MADNELVEAFERAWDLFRQAVAEADLNSPTKAGWTVKELLSHVAFWDECVGPVLHMFLRGNEGMPSDWPGFASGFVPPDDGSWPDADVHNAREAEWARSQHDDAVLTRLDNAHVQARGYLARLTPEEVADERFRNYVIGEKVAHYDEHRRELAE